MHPGDRHLTRNGLERALAAGRDVEQWLGARCEGDRRVLKWLSIGPDQDGRVAVRVYEVWDEGGPHFIDVYEFTSCDPDKEYTFERVFDDADGALRFAVSTLGADPDRFVNAGIVQFEYADSLPRTPGTR